MVIVCALLCLLCLPQPAHAWGGGIHLQVGLHILSHPELLPAGLAALLAAHPLDYLYGSIAADITLGKKYTHYLLNCHRWSVGNKVLLVAPLPFGQYERYLGLTATVASGPFTAGSVRAFLTRDPQFWTALGSNNPSAH